MPSNDGAVHARSATPGDHAEVLRLAGVMFEAIGTPADAQWTAAASSALRDRLGDDVAVFVVDSPDDEGCLIAVAAGSIHRRLPVPGRPEGTAGFVQWVSTDGRYRRRGASRAVMSALMGWFDEREVEVVELHATTAGEPLYRALGFDDPAARNLRRSRRRGSDR